MPALWSPEEHATRFAPYIEEVRDVFVQHGQHFGSPEDIRALAERLESPSGFSDEVGSLMRAIVLREGGALPRADLLEILAIASAGPHMDPAGHELQHSVRRLLFFLHSVLRRPWNEPPGEERLHPPQLPVDEVPDRRAAKPETGRVVEHGTQSNVIPFGGSRAIYSRLTRIEPGRGDELSPAPGSGRARIVLPGHEVADSASETRPADAPAPAPASEFVIASGSPAQPASMPEPESSEPEPTIGECVAPAEEAAGAPVQGSTPAEVEALEPTEDLDSFPTVHTPTAEPSQPKTPDFNSVVAIVPIQPEDLAPAVTADSDSVAADILPPEPAPAPAALALAGVPVASQPSLLVRAIPPPPTSFGAEPALPSSARPNRFVLIGSAAAAVLVAAVVILTLHGKSSGADVALQPSPNSGALGLSATTMLAGTAKATPFAETRAPAVPPLPRQSGRRMRPSADDYIAPPYSNMPAVQPEVRRSDPSPASGSNAKLAGPPSGTMSPVVEAVEGNAHPRPYGDPDTRIAGDIPVRDADIAAPSERPSHPSVPSAVMASNVISAPRPGYPMLAKLAHAEGEVVLEAEISRDGAVSPIRVLGGHRLLRHAAEDAVRRWRFRPYVVNGRAVDVSTTVTVRFSDR